MIPTVSVKDWMVLRFLSVVVVCQREWNCIRVHIGIKLIPIPSGLRWKSEAPHTYVSGFTPPCGVWLWKPGYTRLSMNTTHAQVRLWCPYRCNLFFCSSRALSKSLVDSFSRLRACLYVKQRAGHVTPCTTLGGGVPPCRT